jgi:hypothetical protein
VFVEQNIHKFLQSQKNGGKKIKMALTSNQKYLISPLISVGQHESVSYAQDLCGRVKTASVNSGASPSAVLGLPVCVTQQH